MGIFLTCVVLKIFCIFHDFSTLKWYRKLKSFRLGPLLLMWINFIPAWMYNYIHYKVYDDIINPLPNFNIATVQDWGWISNFISHFTVCDYLSMLGLKLIHVRKRGSWKTRTGVTSKVTKQRVLMHGHQGWNVRHGLCHIYMRYVYIYELFIYELFIAFVSFVVCSLL